ncbi:MAG: hypothetical protein Q9164_002252 [Protoblastenia rupestris]
MPAATEVTAESSLTRQLAALPDELLMAAESQWLFTEEELLRTPSIIDGLPPKKERENRSKGVNFILQVGIMLKLPQITLATASVFLHRFYMRHSMQDVPGRPGHHYYSMAATSLFLATKVEENCRKMKELVVACVRVAQKDPYKIVDEQDKEYWRWRDNILLNEDLLLEAICFDLRLESPYKTLYDLLSMFGEENNKRLRNAAWAFISDSCLTTLCLLFASRTIATSALYAAAKHSGVAFPDDDTGRPWWEVIGVDLEDIARACNYMAEVYQGAPAKAGRENGLYEKTLGGIDEAHDTTRLPGSQREPGASIKDKLRRNLERGENDSAQVEGSPYTNGDTKGLNNDITHVHGSNTDDSSPRKRIKLSEEGQGTASIEVADRPETSLDRLQGATATIQPQQQNTSPSQLNGVVIGMEESQDRGDLVSPRLDDGSEEGEVDA